MVASRHISPISFCHIAPVSYLKYVADQPVHLLLAHLVEENEEYRKFYQQLKEARPDVMYHLDNSAFEMYKRGENMYPTNKLIEMGKLVQADSIVMSDYPRYNWRITVDAAEEMIPQLKQEGFKTFFVPQSELGDMNGLIHSFEWSINNPDVDYIGVSILACPIAAGIDEPAYGESHSSDTFRLQRYLARWDVFRQLEYEELLSPRTYNRFHCLGMTDGPSEIELLAPYAQHIFSWDSSSAVWHGIHGIKFDSSPTGLRDGKLNTEVDFNFSSDETDVGNVLHNIAYIDELCDSL